jgi:prepilin-type N-terminal cleavage/methylation domain-containing protein
MRSERHQTPGLACAMCTYSGFSLVEALVTISIISILATIAVPQVSAQVKRLTVRSEASSLRLFLERCSAYALTVRSPVEVALSPSTLSAQHQNGPLIGVHTLQNGVILEPLAGGAHTLLFYPSISASPATLVLNKGSTSCSVIVSLRGRIRFVC